MFTGFAVGLFVGVLAGALASTVAVLALGLHKATYWWLSERRRIVNWIRSESSREALHGSTPVANAMYDVAELIWEGVHVRK